ncbi:MAG: hypothetical protein ACPGVU_14425 [Limisphaerales bacterium]
MMTPSAHTFHIPVMGTGHSIDTPIRVAQFGISSVISLVDDILLDRIGCYYRERFGLEPVIIQRREEDGRAKRITAYLDAVHEIVRRKFRELKALPLRGSNDKAKYLEMLPETSPLKADYQRCLEMDEGPERDALEAELTERLQPGSIDVNIMVKLDRTNYDRQGNPLPEEYSDSLAALRGFANSKLESNLVLSAGINQRLFGYLSKLQDFYRDQAGRIRKQIVIKVSDFRSALLQAKVLAKKGLEVSEFRVESGLNCGGHAFAANGLSLACVLAQFRDKIQQITKTVRPLIRKHYAAQGRELTDDDVTDARISVQGGIGTQGEVQRLREEYGIRQTGWGTPFLLVPEATCVDDATRKLLMRSGESDHYLSNVSPLGIPFNNVRHTGSERRTRQAIDAGDPGSACPKGYLASSTEFTDRPLCPASKAYQRLKLKAIGESDLSPEEQEKEIACVTEKTCICDHLGNGALIALGLTDGRTPPQSICPGPNMAWFNESYTLRQMVDHIYGRGPSLVPAERPHMFAKEANMLISYLDKQLEQAGSSPASIKQLRELHDNIQLSLDECERISAKAAFPNENLESLRACLTELSPRLDQLRERVEILAADTEAICVST